MTILQAALLALLYWVSQAKVWYGFSIMSYDNLCSAGTFSVHDDEAVITTD